MCMHWLWVQKVTGAHRERTEENREADNSIQSKWHEQRPLKNKYNSYLRYNIKLSLDDEEYVHILRGKTENKFGINCGKFSVPE